MLLFPPFILCYTVCAVSANTPCKTNDNTSHLPFLNARTPTVSTHPTSYSCTVSRVLFPNTLHSTNVQKDLSPYTVKALDCNEFPSNCKGKIHQSLFMSLCETVELLTRKFIICLPAILRNSCLNWITLKYRYSSSQALTNGSTFWKKSKHSRTSCLMGGWEVALEDTSKRQSPLAGVPSS